MGRVAEAHGLQGSPGDGLAVLDAFEARGGPRTLSLYTRRMALLAARGDLAGALAAHDPITFPNSPYADASLMRLLLERDGPGDREHALELARRFASLPGRDLYTDAGHTFVIFDALIELDLALGDHAGALARFRRAQYDRPGLAARIAAARSFYPRLMGTDPGDARDPRDPRDEVLIEAASGLVATSSLERSAARDAGAMREAARGLLDSWSGDRARLRPRLEEELGRHGDAARTFLRELDRALADRP